MEEWRVITDFPNYYVSNLGNVKNIKTSKIMKQTIKSGYYHVCLTNETIKKIFKIHRLVALSFINNLQQIDRTSDMYIHDELLQIDTSIQAFNIYPMPIYELSTSEKKIFPSEIKP